MQRSIFGVFTAFLFVICLLCAIPAFQKKRYGLGIFFLLNASLILLTPSTPFMAPYFKREMER